jgi:hypothetical protein
LGWVVGEIYVGVVMCLDEVCFYVAFGKIPRLIFNKIMSMAYFCARRYGEIYMVSTPSC